MKWRDNVTPCQLIRDSHGEPSALSIKPVVLEMIPTGWTVEPSTIGEAVRLLLAAIGRGQVVRYHESEVVRCCNCARIWVGRSGERCTFCTAEPARIDWRRVILTLVAVALIAAATVVSL